MTQIDAASLDSDRLATLASQIMAGSIDLAAVIGITEPELEAVYSLGHGFYTAGQYEDARDIFRFLCLHRHMDKRFWFGLGAACQMLQDYATATTAYRTCAMLDLTDAQVPLRAAACFRALGDMENLRMALEATIEVARDNPAQAIFGERAQRMLDQLDVEAAAPA